MKLEHVNWQFTMARRRDWASCCRRQRQKIGTGILYLVAMAHPYQRVVRYIAKERLGWIQHAALGPAEPPQAGEAVNFGPQDVAGQMHAIADPQDWQPEVEDRGIAPRSARFVYARRAARKDQGERIELANSLCRDIVTDDPRKRMPLTNPARDQLDVLGTEIEDQDGA